VRRAILALMVVVLAAATAACDGGRPKATSQPAASTTGTATQPATGNAAKATRLPRGSEPVRLDPARFTNRIDNPYWPMKPGSRWLYRETDGAGMEQRIEVTVTKRTKKILGIDAAVVHDVVTEDGQLVEDTYDWYAQDADGNIWYLGEATKEYENAKVTTTAGSWEAGVDGAQPGVLVPAHPRPGLAYRQEYYRGEAEDAATVLSLDQKAKVPHGSFDQLLATKDYTPLEPRLVEHKFYAKGVGQVLAVTVSGGKGWAELLSFKPGS
jgi:hypothetical protein